MASAMQIHDGGTAALSDPRPPLHVLAGGLPTRSVAPLPRPFGTDAELRQSMLGRALDAMGDAAFLLHRDGHLDYANRSAQALLDAGDALRLRSGRLETTDPNTRADVTGMIAAAGGRGETGAASLHTRSGGRLNVTVIAADAAGSVLMLAAWIRRDGDRSLAQPVKAFGLTRAEADVARAIAAGDAPVDIAAARGVFLATVQTQIKTVAAKLGCRRQSEIAAIVQAMPCLR